MQTSGLIAVFLFMGLMSAVLPVIAVGLGRTDPAEIYLVLGITGGLPDAGVQEIGPQQAPFSRMVEIDAATHRRLVNAGYWIIPASQIAALCGIPVPLSKGS